MKRYYARRKSDRPWIRVENKTLQETKDLVESVFKNQKIEVAEMGDDLISEIPPDYNILSSFDGSKWTDYFSR